ncbi:MAG: hypothetical protein AAGK04_11305 [Planctomycetota bacterium]
MLVELTDIKGETWFVNPSYVYLMHEKKGRTQVWVTGHSVPLKIDRPLLEVSTEISAALQTIAGTSMTGPQAGVQQAQQAAQAATTAATTAAFMG